MFSGITLVGEEQGKMCQLVFLAWNCLFWDSLECILSFWGKLVFYIEDILHQKQLFSMPVSQLYRLQEEKAC